MRPSEPASSDDSNPYQSTSLSKETVVRQPIRWVWTLIQLNLTLLVFPLLVTVVGFIELWFAVLREANEAGNPVTIDYFYHHVGIVGIDNRLVLMLLFYFGVPNVFGIVALLRRHRVRSERD